MVESSSERHISSIDLKKWLDQGSNDYDLFLLDVREPDEFKEWNIDGSVNIPLSKLASNKESINDIPKDKRIITICSHGNRSTVAKYLLERYGFNVSPLVPVGNHTLDYNIRVTPTGALTSPGTSPHFADISYNLDVVK